jgi:Tol biopolymer transport system component
VLPFRSDYEQALVYSIMNDEPTGMREIRKDIPVNIELIVHRLMAKDPADRYASANDLLLDLLAVRENSSTPLSASVIGRIESAKHKRRLVIGIAAVILASAVALALFVLPKRGAVRTNPNHVTRVLYTQSYQTGSATTQLSCYPGISWDGDWVSTAAPNDSGQWGLYFMRIGWNEPRRIPVQGNVGIAKISPDGALIAFMGGRGLLQVVSTSGGEVMTLENDFHNLTWRPNGTMLGYSRDLLPQRKEFWSVKKDGTDKRLVFSDSVTSYMNAACWSPNGQSVAYIRTFREGHSELITRDLRTGKEQQLTFDRKYADEPIWMSNGNTLFASTRSGSLNIWAIPEQGGEPVEVTTSGGSHQGATASGDGKRILVPETDVLSEIWISDVLGSHIRQTKLNRFVSHFAMAPDYARFVFISPEGLEQWVVYVADKDGTNRRRIGRPRKLPGGRTLSSLDATVLFYEKTPGKVWRIRLPGYKEDFVGPTSTILDRFPAGTLNIDGTQGAFIRHNTTQKLTLIENLFE